MLLHRLQRHGKPGKGKSPKTTIKRAPAPAAAPARAPAPREPARPVQAAPAPQAAPQMPRGRTIRENFDPAAVTSITSGVMKALLDRQDSVPDANRDLSGSTHVHWSSLLRSLCLRQIRFADEEPNAAHVKTELGGMRVVWAIGRAVEHHIRTQYLALVGKRGVLGKWECPCGETAATDVFSNSFAACPLCGNRPDIYREMLVQDNVVNIKGHPDMLIFLGGKLYVVEIKSINDREFKELKQPKPDHVFQGMGYRRMLRGMGYDVADQIIVIYCTKDFKFGSPYLDWVVPVTPSTENVLDALWAKAAALKRHREEGTRPERTECRDANSPMAKECPFVADCFSRR